MTLTKARYILNIVRNGYIIEFLTEPYDRAPINFNSKEQEIITSLLKKFEDKGNIVKSIHETGGNSIPHLHPAKTRWVLQTHTQFE